MSNAGNVRIEVRRQNIRAGQHLEKSSVKDGYLRVSLSKSGTLETTTRRMVHRCPIPEGYVVTHLDGDMQNNRVSNLEACTNRENIAHSMRVLGNRRDGTHNPAAKLTEQDVVAIRERAARGEPRSKIAKDYGICNVSVCNIANGRAWKQCGGPLSTTPNSRRLNPEQRAEAVRRVLSGEADIRTVASELGVHRAAIYHHLRKAKRVA